MRAEESRSPTGDQKTRRRFLASSTATAISYSINGDSRFSQRRRQWYMIVMVAFHQRNGSSMPLRSRRRRRPERQGSRGESVGLGEGG
ncbi:hypothetical protein TIFTF001_041757 [Ficus carica]|uniref:Uncharacterized protein n=1 Tax=Ficus carica TaxID=3494 RepID=A0AA87ZH04_FICCA|nr:hypothetical protein TIFTF001_041757 [Ficus carica]